MSPRRLMAPDEVVPSRAAQLSGLPIFAGPSPYQTDDVRPPIARLTDPPASHEAAVRAFGNAKAQEKWIMGALRVFGAKGATAREIAEALGDPWTNVTVSRRIAALREAGYLVTHDGKAGPGHRWPALERDGCHVHVAVVAEQRKAS